MTSLLILLAVILLAGVLFALSLLVDIRIEQRILRDEIVVLFRLLHSIDRNVAEIITKTEAEGDI